MATKTIRGATIEQKRAILASNKGQIFNCEWVTKDGKPCDRQLKQWIDGALVYGKENLQANPAAHNPNNFTAVDLAKYAKWCDDGQTWAWVNVSLKNLHKATIGGTTYIFQD